MTAYYYHDGANEIGPLAFETLRKMAEAGIIGRNTLIRPAEGDGWTPFESVTDQTDEPPSSTPLDRVHETAVLPTAEAAAAAEAATLNGWLSSPVTPWRRYAARSIDVMIFGFLGFAILSFAFFAIAPYSAAAAFAIFDTPVGVVIDFVLTSLMAALIGGPVVGLTGSSIGKWIFGVKVTRTDRSRPGLGAGLVRDLDVFVRGLGLGIPLLSLIFPFMSYARLKGEGATVWDDGRYTIWHRPPGPLQWTLNVIGILLLIAMSLALRVMSEF